VSKTVNLHILARSRHSRDGRVMGYIEGRASRLIVANLKRGSDLLRSLEILAEQTKIKGGVFTGIGAVSKASFAFYDQTSRSYVNFVKDEELELLSCSGSFGVMQGRPKVHCHVLFSDREGRAFGGHLLEGTTVFVVEIHLAELRGVSLERAQDPDTGVAKLVF
jgi:predicted DNA-binding protein with PD1-like motif